MCNGVFCLSLANVVADGCGNIGVSCFICCSSSSVWPQELFWGEKTTTALQDNIIAFVILSGNNIPNHLFSISTCQNLNHFIHQM